MFAALHAERSSRLRGRRPTRAPAGTMQPEPVRITRVTVIAAEPFADADEARAWLERCGGRGEEGGDEISDALSFVNRAVTAYRVSAADPHAHDVAREQATRVRLGFGSGPTLVDGTWDDALVMPPLHGRPRVRRRMLAPEQELAGILTGRKGRAQPSEELLLRARHDLDAGRVVEAAMQARVAAEALSAELAREGATDAGLAKRVDAATRLSQAALSGELGEEQVEELDTLVSELERAVRRRRYAGTD